MLVIKKTLLAITLLSVISLAGCGGESGQEMGQVSGTITKGGAPLVGASLEFYPEGDGAASYGKSDEQGNFTLRYSTGKPGAIVGEHKVTVIGGTSKGGAAAPSEGLATLTEGDSVPKPVGAPGAGGSKRGGAPKPVEGITATVKAGEENHIVIEL
ncbi:carboxypeptidase regulatory-like domain-containing protein [Bremerella cremea]|uniref:Carboxypeptidase regulatory-like domain-containing protein n=1 Tax=Bremerella cremea TaxID=1031537 RepID=A0A368KVJ4_9BACT|nr:carboxypeptidase-like regulatory domain-containing protein [Bremerella cremea]RCS52751.1 carboxypeptidase regulatory-like domain-containing protein [Bremerella cremea]